MLKSLFGVVVASFSFIFAFAAVLLAMFEMGENNVFLAGAFLGSAFWLVLLGRWVFKKF